MSSDELKGLEFSFPLHLLRLYLCLCACVCVCIGFAYFTRMLMNVGSGRVAMTLEGG